MQEKLLSLLACPDCLSELTCHPDEIGNENIITGQLNCASCQKNYPIIRGIPRFVPLDNYSASFGFQWNLFKHTQVDSYSKVPLSYRRFTSETGWTPENLQQEWILDGGCGNGRFLEVASCGQADVVGVDLSSAVDAAGELFKNRKNVHLIQASLLQLPFRPGVFDKCYCIGVIQHTPDPEKVVRELPRIVKKGGELAVTIYEKRKYTMLSGKYFFRRMVRKIKKEKLLTGIKSVAPVLFPITEVLFRIPKLGSVFQFAIPFANYVNETDLTWRQRYETAILDTFDALSPAYDLPQTQQDVEEYLKECSMVDIKRTSSPGLNIIATKAG